MRATHSWVFFFRLLQLISLPTSKRLRFWRRTTCTRLRSVLFSFPYRRSSGFGGLEVACWPLVPRFAGSNPGRSRRIFQGEKILSTPPFGREVNPFVPYRTLRQVKDPWMLRGSRAFSGKIHQPFLVQVVLPFTARVSGGDTWRCKSLTRVCAISLRLQCIRGH